MIEIKAPFAKSLKAFAALYAADNDWQLVASGTDQPPSPPFINDDFQNKVHYLVGVGSFADLANQIYIDPVILDLNPALPSKWILLVSVSGGEPMDDGVVPFGIRGFNKPDFAGNRIAHAWRIEYFKDDDRLHADYVGLFGGPTIKDRVAAALGAQNPASTLSNDGKEVMLQATFNLVNTLVQYQKVPWTFALQPQAQYQEQSVPETTSTVPDSVTTGNTTHAQDVSVTRVKDGEKSKGFALALAAQVGYGIGSEVTNPPPPTFFVSYNVVLKLPSPGPWSPPADRNKLQYIVTFENDKDKLTDPELRNLYAWVVGLKGSPAPPAPPAPPSTPDQVRLGRAIRLGYVPVHIVGSASKRSDSTMTMHNMELSQHRADSVRGALQGPTSASGGGTMGGFLGGDQVKFQVEAFGAFQPPSDPLSLDVGRQAQVYIDADEAGSGIRRMELAPRGVPSSS